MSALDELRKKDKHTDIELAIMASTKYLPNISEKAAAELDAVRAESEGRLTALNVKAEEARHAWIRVEKAKAQKDSLIVVNDELHEKLRRYKIYYEDFNGYEKLAEEFGGCEHPESSVWLTEWLDRVLMRSSGGEVEG